MARRQAFDDVAAAECRVLTLGRQVHIVTALREFVDNRLEVAEIPVMQRGEKDFQRRPVRWVNIRT